MAAHLVDPPFIPADWGVFASGSGYNECADVLNHHPPKDVDPQPDT